jgi:hypothetical protein
MLTGEIAVEVTGVVGVSPALWYFRHIASIDYTSACAGTCEVIFCEHILLLVCYVFQVAFFECMIGMLTKISKSTTEPDPK